MKTKYLLVPVISIMASFAGYAQKESDFDEWDANHDGKIDRNEYMLNSKTFEDWDRNNDDRISPEEFQKAFFAIFSEKGKEIDNKELMRAGNLLNADEDTVGSEKFNIETYDLDKNGALSQHEFSVIATKIFNKIDVNRDNFISKTEFYDKTFYWWDLNRNGFIEKEEFNKVRKIINPEGGFLKKIF